MSMYISGIALNKDFSRNLNELTEAVNLKITPKGQTNFKMASTAWVEQDQAYIYCAPGATLLFLHPDHCTEAFPVKQLNTLAFAISEADMTSEMHYTHNGFHSRSLIEQEGEIIDEEGDELENEENSGDVQEMIWDQLDEILGLNFWDVKPSARVIQCDIRKVERPVVMPTRRKEVEVKEMEEKVEANTSWWKFWKK